MTPTRTQRAQVPAVEAAEERPHDIHRRYEGDAERPLGGYALTAGTYSAAVVGFVLLVRSTSRRFPVRFPLPDFVLLILATHKLSRLIAKDAVTSPLRAPFTRFEEAAGASELNEEVRGSGIRHTIGELISCPFCLDVWVATALAGGLVVAPGLTRWVASIFGVVGVSDWLQFGYDALKRTEG